jgi:hypothetical protein
MTDTTRIIALTRIVDVPKFLSRWVKRICDVQAYSRRAVACTSPRPWPVGANVFRGRPPSCSAKLTPGMLDNWHARAAWDD